MKSFLVYGLAFLAANMFFSCNKSNDQNPGPAIQDSLRKTASLYLPLTHSRVLEIFTYDNQSRLVQIRGYNYDTSNGTPDIDSFFVHFIFHAPADPPVAYDQRSFFEGESPAGSFEHHLLFYDAKQRVTIDSIAVSDEDLFSVEHYLYDGNGNTTGQLFYGDPQTPGSYYGIQIDTMNIQNENLITDARYSFGSDQASHLFTRSYSSDLNPLYNSAFANSLGCWMIFKDFGFDFRSRYLPGQFDSQVQAQPPFSLQFLWTDDASSGVINGMGRNKDNGFIQQVYRFTY